METKIREVNSFTREIDITVPWEDLKDKFQAEFNKFRAKYSQPGFRKGKVPVSILKRNYGEALEMDFADKACNDYYKIALDELEIDPIARAQIGDLQFHEGEDLRFTAVFEVKPPVKLPDYSKKIKLTVVHMSPTDTDFEGFLNERLQQLSKFEPFEGGAEEGHIIKGEFQELDAQGNAADGKDPQKKYFLLGGQDFSGDILKAFLGRKKGETVEVDLPVQGKPTKFEVTIEQIEKQLIPEASDEIAAKIDPEVTSLEALKAKVLEKMQGQLDNEFDLTVQSKITDYFVEKSEVDVPTSWKENYLRHTVEDVRRQLKPGEPFNEAEIRKSYSDSADRNLKWHLIREELLKVENLEVSEDEIDRRIEKLISENEKEAKRIRTYYKKADHRSDLKEDIANEILFERLKEFTIIKEIAKTTDEFREENKTDE
ncbi:MAG: trigger factor [FCB group bacterium]|nr:trigger factor [FCB group bacterium]